MKYFSCILILLSSFDFYGQNVYHSFFNPTVVDSLGVVIDNPFNGGLKAPQTYHSDLNGDGVKDYLIFEREGNVPMAFLSENGKLVHTYDHGIPFRGIENWLVAKDLNGDDILDLLTYKFNNPINGMTILLGYFDNNKILFEEIDYLDDTDLLSYDDGQGERIPIYCNPIDKPEVIDIDNDGDFDILSFDISGSHVVLYKNLAVEKELDPDQFEFILDDPCYGRFIESETSEDVTLSSTPGNCAENIIGETEVSSRHAGSTITAFDLNEDNDYDLLIGDLVSRSVTGLYNDGDPSNAWMIDFDNSFPSETTPIDMNLFVAAYSLDYDSDGDLDLLFSPNSLGLTDNIECIHLYENRMATDEGFQFVQNDFIINSTLDFGEDSNPVLEDINNDGLVDLIIGTSGRNLEASKRAARVYFYVNEGTPEVPYFKMKNDDLFGLFEYDDNFRNFSPCFGDLDNDGDLDAIVGLADGSLLYIRNTSSEPSEMSFGEITSNAWSINVGQNAKPYLFDISGDGLLDLVVGERSVNSFQDSILGNVNYYENIGSLESPEFLTDSSFINYIPTLGRINTRGSNWPIGSSAPSIVKTEESLLLMTGSYSRGLLLYEINQDDLEGKFIQLTEKWGNVHEGWNVTGNMKDIDNDGLFEVVVGNKRGGIAMFKTNLNSEGTLNTVIDNSLNHSNIHFYPNPASEYIMFDNTPEWIEIYDIAGKRIINKEVTSNQLNIEFIQSGIYFIKIDGKLSRFVKI